MMSRSPFVSDVSRFALLDSLSLMPPGCCVHHLPVYSVPPDEEKGGCGWEMLLT